MTSATYVYAVTTGVEPGALAGLRGIAGAPVRLLDVEGLVALASSVPLAEFGSEPLHRNLEDLGWLEATARAHHGVVEAGAALGPTAPLRLATVYHDDRRAYEVLRQRRAELGAALARIEGRSEWGVKVYDDPATAAAPQAVAGPAAGPGASYLQRRRLERDATLQRGRAAAERAEAVHRALAETASASRRYPPQDQRLTGHSGVMVLNAAYLMEPAAAATLRTRIGELAGGARFELTGPWAPYSFTVLEQGS